MKEASEVGTITRELTVQQHLTHRQKRYVSLLARYFLYPRKSLTIDAIRDFESQEHLTRDTLMNPLAWLVIHGFVETNQYEDGTYYYTILPEVTL